MTSQPGKRDHVVWEYDEARVDGSGIDDPVEVRADWYEMLNKRGRDGWELVTEHVETDTGTNSPSYWGTLKLRHDTTND